jgi:6-phosphogluconolactonase (cycloisomerase 2 family)
MKTLKSGRFVRSLCIALVLAGLVTTPASGVPGGVPTPPPRFLTFVEAEYDYMGLDAPSSVAVSPDNKHVYVANYVTDSVVVFERDTSAGTLAVFAMETDGMGGVDGMDGPRSVAVSPDGSHVYVASYADGAVVAFSRNASTGALTYVETEWDDDSGVDGLDGARSVIVSPDNDHVYVAGSIDDAVAVFGRNTTTGELTFVEVHKDDSQGGTVDGLDGARSVIVSPDNNHVYVASDMDDAVTVFDRNTTTGELTFVEVHKDDSQGGTVDGLASARSVAIDPDGDHVYAAGDGDHAVAVFSRNTSTGALTFVEMQQDGVGGVDGLRFVESVTVSPDGDHVYAASKGDDAVAVFDRNKSSGALTFVEMQQDGAGGVDGLDDARSLTVSPDGNHVYALGYSDDAIVAFWRNGATGALTFADVKMHTSPAYTMNELDGARSVAVSPDGNHVYVAARQDDALTAFSREGTTGELHRIETVNESMPPVDGLTGANSITVSPDGKHVYVASVEDDAVAVFSRTVPLGTLDFVEMEQDNLGGVDSLNFATSVIVSPDGKHVYVTAAIDDAITAFWRHPTTGELTVIDDYVDGDNGGFVDGLDGAYSAAISPDGYHVYVAGNQDDAVAVFVRNATTGRLTFIQIVTDSGPVANGLDGARSVGVSPDGKHVYVASSDADTLTVYDRNPNTGNLTFVEIHQDDTSGAFGLDGAHAVAVSPDGLFVYASGADNDALTVFSRDAVSGTLTLREEIWDNVQGVHGLDYPSSIAVSPDGRHVYVTGSLDDSVAAFERHLYIYLPLVLQDF